MIYSSPVQYHYKRFGEWSKDLDTTLQKLVGNRAKDVLRKMQKACLSGFFNTAHMFKVVT